MPYLLFKELTEMDLLPRMARAKKKVSVRRAKVVAPLDSFKLHYEELKSAKWFNRLTKRYKKSKM